jgi:hypothetical protein
MHRNFQTAPNEKVHLVDNAVSLFSKHRLPLLGRNPVEIKQNLGADSWHSLVPLVAGNAFETEQRKSPLLSPARRSVPGGLSQSSERLAMIRP